MKQISKIIKKENPIREFNSIVVTKDGVIVYNGKLGVRYGRKLSGEKLCNLAKNNGNFAILDSIGFLRIFSTLENIKSLEINENDNVLEIKFGARGITKIPVVMDLSKDIPHLNIKWKDFNKTKETKYKINSLWEAMYGLTTNDGDLVWGDIIGIYGRNKKIISFDYGVYIVSDEVDTPDFFCPRVLLDLGTKDMSHFVVDGNQLFLIGEDYQYVFTGLETSDVVEELLFIKDSFDSGDKYKVDIDFLSSVWKRARLFVQTMVRVKIEKKEIFLLTENWRECIGKVDIPDVEFTVRLSVIERWVKAGFSHFISKTEDGSYYLSSKTKANGGLNFYAAISNNLDNEEEEGGADNEQLEDVDEGFDLASKIDGK